MVRADLHFGPYFYPSHCKTGILPKWFFALLVTNEGFKI